MIDNEETAEQAYNNIPDKRDPNGPDGPVSFIWRGNGDIALPKELVENGSFETANFSGWVKGFTAGGDFPHYACPGSPDYSVVVSEEAVEGNFAARVGKWTQVYTGGLHGPPMPGEEPAGINWIYQDVELPAAPAKTLTFWWRLKEYDTALWSWFDMFVKDPNTDSNLATVVSRAGKPGVDFGVFWDSDWQYVSYDLSAFAGQTVRLWFGNRQDGYGDQCTTYVDDAQQSNQHPSCILQYLCDFNLS